MEVSGLSLGPVGATFIIGITTLLLLLWSSSRKHAYWKKRGVPFVKPYPFIGSIWEDFIKPQHILEQRRYNELGPIYGHYEGNSAALSVADPTLIKNIAVKDFAYFSGRRKVQTSDPIVDSIIANLEGEDWKRVRTIITPTFTTGKLKRMLGIFKECSMTLVENFKKTGADGKSINLKKLYGAMTMDVIASAAFSTKLDSHNDPENKFVQMSRTVSTHTINWRMLLFAIAPGLMKSLGISVFFPELLAFFKNVAVQIIDERKRLKQSRNDFLQLLMDTADEVIKEEKLEENDKNYDLLNNYGEEVASQKIYTNSVTKNLTTNEMVAQCVVFFIVGYETTAVTLTNASYCLAVNPEVQEKARQEIRNCLEQSQGEITYEAIQNMKYLDNVISETLRMLPPATRLERRAEADYKLGDTNITIKKDMIVTIPIYAIHNDPKYYPDPGKFCPERFSAEERAKRDPYVYMPFGAGPRNCIAMRFALLETKICLIHVLSHFNIKTCSETQIPLQFHPVLGMMRTHDIYLKMEPRDDCLLK